MTRTVTPYRIGETRTGIVYFDCDCGTLCREDDVFRCEYCDTVLCPEPGCWASEGLPAGELVCPDCFPRWLNGE